MIEVYGKDGRVFRFQDGTPDEVVKAALDKHYSNDTQEDVVQVDEAPLLPTQSTATGPIPAIQSQDVVAATTPQPSVTPQQAAPPTSQYQSVSSQSDATPAASETAMRFAMMAGAAALGVLAVTILLWASGMIGKTSETKVVGVPAGTETPGTFVATPQPDMRQALVATQIRKSAKSDGAVLKELVAGATVDVLGEQAVGGAAWLRVRVDQTTASEGYVVASHLGAIGAAAPGLSVVEATGGGLSVPPQGRTAGSIPNEQIPGVAVPGPQSAMPVTTYYVVSRQLNVRAAATPDAARVGRLNFQTPIIADAQSNYQGRVWLRIRSNSGVSGWVNSDLVSLTPATTPIDEIAYAAPPPGRYVPTAPAENYSNYGRGDLVRVMALNANVRAEPSARGGTDTVIDVAPNGASYKVQRSVFSSGKTWYQITTSKGITGWISADTVTTQY